MANNVKVGTLYYELNAGGNLLDILNKSKKEAIDLGKTIESINKKEFIKTSNKSYNNLTKAKRVAALMALETDRLAGAAAKAALEQERLARVNEIASRSADRHALSQQKLATETLRTEAASKKLAASQSGFERAIGLTNKTMFSQKNLLNQLSNAAGIYFSIYEVGRFVKNLAQVSGEFEQQHIALRAILRDADSADRIFAQIKDLSVISPFTFKDLTSYTKQLSAFQVPINELYDTTKRLADVSAGLGVDMSRIILAYGQVRSASVLRGQELRQFTEAGIPLVDELAKKFGELENRVVSASEVFDKISTRQVPFEMVKDVFQEMTDEGGMFYNMQEKLSESLAGKLSNLTDAYQIMLSDIGKANDGILKGGVEALTSLMNHWEAFADILKTIIASYGVYKASIITTNALQKVFGKELDFTNAKLKIQSFLLKSNPWSIALSAITAIVGAIYSYVSSLNRANRELLENITTLNKQKDSVNKIFEELKKVNEEQQNVAKNIKDANEQQKQSNTLTAKRARLLNELSQKEPEVAKSIKDHADNLEELIKVQERYNAIMDARKFAEYVIKEPGGWFDDSLLDDLKDFEEQQNKTSLSAAKLELTYTKIREELDKVSKTGNVSNIFGEYKFPENIKREIDNAMTSAENFANKVRSVYDILYNSKRENTKASILFHKIFSEDDEKAVVKYIENLELLNIAEKEAEKELAEKGEAIRQNLSLKGIDVYAKENEEYIRSFVKSLSDLTEYGQKTILTKWNIEFNGKSNPEETLEGWRKELDEITGKKYTAEIRASVDVKDAVKTLQEKLKEVNDDINKIKPILINAGYNFDTESLPSILNEQAKEINESFIRQYKGLKSNQDSLIKGLGLLGALPTEKTSGKDAVTENLKTQLNLIKEAISQYKKLREVMSEENAVNRVKSIPGFESVDTKYFKDNGLETALTDSLNKIQNRNTDAAKKVRETWNKELRNIKIDEFSKNVRKELFNIQEYIDRYVSQYNLYEQLFGMTGRKDLSWSIAFDADVQGLDILDFMKAQLEKMLDSSGYEGLNFFDILKLTNEQKSELPKEIQNLFDTIIKKSEEMKNQTKIQVAKALNEYQTYEQEIQNVITKYDELIKKAKEIGTSQAGINALENQKNKEVSDKRFEQLKKSEDWVLAFEDLDRLSTSTIKRLIQSFEQLKESDKSMDLVNMKELGQVIENLRREVLERNPFNALSKGIKDLAKAKEEVSIIKGGGQIIESWELDKTTNTMIPKYKSLAKAQNEVVEATNDIENSTEKLIEIFKSAITTASELTSAISNAFAAFGNEDQADKWDMASKTIGMFTDIASKAASGDFVGAALSALSLPAKLAAAFAEFHDKKLDRQIEKSALQVKKLENAYKNLEWEIERTYGEDKFKKTGELVGNLAAQQMEVAKQLDLERQKKNKDDEAIADYEQQIIELNHQMLELAENVRSKVFDSISSMASELSNAIVNAFKNGENAATAWGNTVDDIILNIVKNMFAVKYIEPMIQEAFDKLDNDVDISGAKRIERQAAINKANVDIKNIEDEWRRRGLDIVSEGNREKFMQAQPEYQEYIKIQKEIAQNQAEIDRLNEVTQKEQLDALKDTGKFIKEQFPEMQEKWDAMSEGAGITPGSTTAEGITKSTQSLTEETGNLLASYTNAIRADVSVIRKITEEGEIRRTNMIKVYMEALTQYPNVFNQIALMQADIKRIEANTFRSANNSDVILQGVNEMNTRFRQATTPGSGIKLNI